MIERITVHSFIQGALKNGSGYLHVAGMILQAITNQRVELHKAKMSETKFSLIRGRTVSMTCDLKGENMYHFLGKLINIVLPRIKDWNGVRATTGDGSGNLMFGFEPDVVSNFPEIEGNYDPYPPKLIPVSATSFFFGASELSRDSRACTSPSTQLPTVTRMLDCFCSSWVFRSMAKL